MNNTQSIDAYRLRLVYAKQFAPHKVKYYQEIIEVLTAKLKGI